MLIINGCAEHKNPVNLFLRNGTVATKDGTLATMVLPLIPVIMLQRPPPPPPLRPLHVLIEVTFVTLLLRIWLHYQYSSPLHLDHIQRLEKLNANSGLKL